MGHANTQRQEEEEHLVEERGKNQAGRRKTKCVGRPRSQGKSISQREEWTASAAAEMLNKMRIKIHCWIWLDAHTGDPDKPLVT